MAESIHNAINVTIIDEAFPMPQLGRTRRIWIYTPQSYLQSKKKYPVVYMHDGQNLFDDATAFGVEWGVDETLNSLLAECIVVGIDNSDRRMTEYNFRDHEEHGKGEGEMYMQFIVQTLKPFIDKKYRTKSGREHTSIAGSSMGGLISLYGALYFAETFGSAGIFSPALWLVPEAADEIRLIAKENTLHPQRFYFYGGAVESADMVPHIENVVTVLSEFSHYHVHVDIDPKGEHSEHHWRNKFADFYAWLSYKKGNQVFKKGVLKKKR
jgi:predicted alpha/beta superfamily hydrolase